MVAVYVKPLDAALRDGIPVRAVIRAAMSNSDGKTQRIAQPYPDAHEAMIRKAYEMAGIMDYSKTANMDDRERASKVIQNIAGSRRLSSHNPCVLLCRLV